MTEFALWATELSASIKRQLGATNVGETIGNDAAMWTYGTNGVKAKLRVPGEPFIEMTFARGGTGCEVLFIAANATLDGARVAGALVAG